MKKKMGRPTTDIPKKNIVGCKLTDIELERLERYCELHKVKKSTVLRDGIKNIISESKRD